MTVQVNTNAYEFAHGKKPRGQGYWAFFFEGFDKVKDTFWHSGTYAEAKQAAVTEAKRRGVNRVTVGS